MSRNSHRRTMLASVALSALFSAGASAESFNVPSGDLAQALDSYTKQSGVQLMISGDEVQGVRTKGVHGSYSADDALTNRIAREIPDCQVTHLPSVGQLVPEENPEELVRLVHDFSLARGTEVA